VAARKIPDFASLVSSLFTFMLQSLSLESRQRIVDSDSTDFYERRIVVTDGSINTITRSTLSDPEIERVWIPHSILNLNWRWQIDSVVFESNSRLTRIESEAFLYASLESILIPSNVEIFGSYCFSHCESLSSVTFESNSRLTRIELAAFSWSSLESILIPSNVEILGSYCFHACESLSSITFESNSQLTRIDSYAFSSSSLNQF
jgi:hypothetical protein